MAKKEPFKKTGKELVEFFDKKAPGVFEDAGELTVGVVQRAVLEGKVDPDIGCELEQAITG